MNNKNTEKNNPENLIPVADLIQYNDSLRKDIDFDKADHDLTSDERAKKEIYLVIDNAVKESLGSGLKNDLDQKRKEIEGLSRLQTQTVKLCGLGREIEKHFALQLANLRFHFNGDNDFWLVVEGMTKDLIDKEKFTDPKERILFANNILEIIRAYKEILEKELVKSQEVISALLPSVEIILKDTDFDFFTKMENASQETKIEFQTYKYQYAQWLSLCEQLNKTREAVIEVVREQIDVNDIIPKSIIENKGDIPQSVSGLVLTSRTERMFKVLAEARGKELGIETLREPLADKLFGKSETDLDISKVQNDPETVKRVLPIGGSVQNPLTFVNKKEDDHNKKILLACKCFVLICVVAFAITTWEEYKYWFIISGVIIIRKVWNAGLEKINNPKTNF